jgi:hypothetical protein
MSETRVEDPPRRLLLSAARHPGVVLLVALAVVALAIAGVAWLGGDSYGQGMVIEATGLVAGSFLLAFFVDALSRVRQEERWERIAPSPGIGSGASSRLRPRRSPPPSACTASTGGWSSPRGTGRPAPASSGSTTTPSRR